MYSFIKQDHKGDKKTKGIDRDAGNKINYKEYKKKQTLNEKKQTSNEKNTKQVSSDQEL